MIAEFHFIKKRSYETSCCEPIIHNRLVTYNCPCHGNSANLDTDTLKNAISLAEIKRVVSYLVSKVIRKLSVKERFRISLGV